MTNETPHPDRLDEATSQRLAKLRAMPIDTSRLEKLIQNQIPRPIDHSSLIRRFVLRPFRAVAASIVVLLLVGIVIWSLSGGSVIASPAVMAQFHHDLISGKESAMKVGSIADANRALAGQWNDSVQFPQVPAQHVMVCCMRSIKDKRVACVLLNSDGGVPVTMAVAQSTDMKLPANATTLAEAGVIYHVQSQGALNMISAQRDGRWICLIGELPVERLIRIASEIAF